MPGARTRETTGMKPELILFDLDGTLADTSLDLTDALNFALSRYWVHYGVE